MEYEMPECLARRQKLSDLMEPQSAIILSSAKMHKKTGDLTFDFRQNAWFAYFTGFIEDDAVVVISKDQNSKLNYIIFCKDKDPLQEIWTGKIIGQESAKQDYLADEAYSIKKLNAQILGVLAGFEQIYYIDDVTHNEYYSKAIEQLKSSTKKLKNLTNKINFLRIVKSAYEIKMLQSSSYASAMAHKKVMLECKAGMSEFYLASVFYSELAKFGGDGLSYPSIVASGSNACVLHHNASKKIIQDGELVLVDAGGESKYYASDITRTYPVNGKFSEAQKAIYEIVLRVQKQAIGLVKPGLTLQEISSQVVRGIVAGLIEIGILKGTIFDNILSGAYKKYYMHGFGHMVGLDVHDIQSANLNLQPGMALTVEPGIYIDPQDQSVDAKWRGIGIRIEDCVLVTASGNEIMTKDVPKEISEIEELMSTNRAPLFLPSLHATSFVEDDKSLVTKTLVSANLK